MTQPKRIILTRQSYKGMNIIRIGFEYDNRIIAEIKKIPGTKWSQGMRTWYIDQSEFDIDYFVQRLSFLAMIDSKELTNQQTQSSVPLFSAKEGVRLPQVYIEKLQQKRYLQG